MSPSNIIFMGTPAFAVPILQALVSRPDFVRICGIVTQPDRPQGRGQTRRPSHVAAWGEARGIATFKPTRLKDPSFEAKLRALNADLAVVAAYGRILPPAVLALPRLGCINVHASDLPRWRGASPVAHAIWHGDTHTAACIMRMEAGLDTGPVYARRRLAIGDHEAAGALTERLAAAGAALLCETLPAVLDGSARPVPQPSGAADVTYAPLLTKADGSLPWHDDAVRLAAQVRALNPWPRAYATLAPRGRQLRRRLSILAAQAHQPAHLEGPGPDASGPTPGSVLAASHDGIFVACGRGVLQLERVQPEGRGPMSAADCARGRGVTADDHFEVSCEKVYEKR